VFVATTNYPEKLGERIINRPSRFDRRLFIDDPSDVARRMYLDEMVKGHKLPKGITVDMMVRDTKGMSLAHVKELFVLSVVIGAPYKEAHANLVEMHFEKPISANDRDKFGSLKAREGQYI
jgi:ATP-dependent 26S proteasome regulatory subunit